jgi:hypothetical protein
MAKALPDLPALSGSKQFRRFRSPDRRAGSDAGLCDHERDAMAIIARSTVPFAGCADVFVGFARMGTKSAAQAEGPKTPLRERLRNV